MDLLPNELEEIASNINFQDKRSLEKTEKINVLLPNYNPLYDALSYAKKEIFYREVLSALKLNNTNYFVIRWEDKSKQIQIDYDLDHINMNVRGLDDVSDIFYQNSKNIEISTPFASRTVKGKINVVGRNAARIEIKTKNYDETSWIIAMILSIDKEYNASFRVKVDFERKSKYINVDYKREYFSPEKSIINLFLLNATEEEMDLYDKAEKRNDFFGIMKSVIRNN